MAKMRGTALRQKILVVIYLGSVSIDRIWPDLKMVDLKKKKILFTEIVLGNFKQYICLLPSHILTRFSHFASLFLAWAQVQQ